MSSYCILGAIFCIHAFDQTWTDGMTIVDLSFECSSHLIVGVPKDLCAIAPHVRWIFSFLDDVSFNGKVLYLLLAPAAEN